MAEWLWRVTQASSLVGVKSISILMGLARGGSNPPLFILFAILASDFLFLANVVGDNPTMRAPFYIFRSIAGYWNG